jgi:BASS family bile acid:Na+ symporter
MDDLLARGFDGLIALTVAMTALAIGTEMSRAVLGEAVRRRALPIVLVANLAAVPIVGLAAVELFGLDGVARTGVLLCAACAGGPLGLKASQIARGDLSWALSLTVILMLSNVVTLPLWSALFFEETIAMRPLELLGGLLVVVLVPVLVGAAVRRRDPARAANMTPWLTTASNITLTAAVALGVFSHADELVATLTSSTAVAALIVMASSAGMAWLIPGSVPVRRVTVLVTLNRATSAALLVVARGFADQPEVLSVVIAFGALQTLAAIGLALALGRSQRVVVHPV